MDSVIRICLSWFLFQLVDKLNTDTEMGDIIEDYNTVSKQKVLLLTVVRLYTKTTNKSHFTTNINVSS